MKSGLKLCEGSMRLLIPFDKLKDCCNENVNLHQTKFLLSSPKADIDLIKRFFSYQVLAGVLLYKSFLHQILIEYILHNGINVSPLVWEFIRRSSISQENNTTDADDQEKNDNEARGERYKDPLGKIIKSPVIINFHISNTLITFKASLKDIKVTENKLKEKHLTLQMLSTVNKERDAFHCKENKWYKELFLRERINPPMPFLILPGTINQSFNKLSQGTPPDDFEIMKFEFHRLSSFSNFTFPDVPSSIILAKAGWFATGSEKETNTFCCLKVYSRWKRSDDPHYIHKMLSPTCFFILGKDIGQISFHDRALNDNNEASVDNSRNNGYLPGNQHRHYSNTSQEILYQRTNDVESLTDEIGQSYTNPKVFKEELSECDNESFAQESENPEIHSTNNVSHLNWSLSDAVYPNQSEIEARIESFSMINKSHYALKIGPGSENFVIANKTAEEFARAGLFYRGFRDRTSCFYCGIGLQNWTSLDNIILRHYQSSGNCPIAQASIHEIDADRNTSSSENSVAASPNQSRGYPPDMEGICAELDEMGFDEELIKAAIESLGHRGMTCTKERIVNEILDNRASLHSGSSISGSAEYNSSEYQESIEPLENPRIETASGENAEKPTAPGEKIDTTASTSNLREQSDDELRRRVTCKVCLSEEVGVLFLPCSHLVSCVSCSRRLKKCPLCRKHIQTKQPMFW
ncbi:E3 ubiquitin-protein ligase XIAP-like [Saccostrea cucullata]|uniref:E3 ubiquitin-protein ligase XIAP-like n=1 Tax=Saccostrea cuccullata TaxID=36930 RepID=UPI002ED44738